MIKSVSKLFGENTAIDREEFLHTVDQAQDVPEKVKRFWHQIQFDDVVVDAYGRINIDRFEAPDNTMR